jgi:hypothetical protein
MQEKKGAMRTADVDTLRENHIKARNRLVQSIANMSLVEIAKELSSERELKNEAYYFILQAGHLEAFKKYSQKVKNRKS